MKATRRTVVWAAPTVVLATQAPAFATSACPQVTVGKVEFKREHSKTKVKVRLTAGTVADIEVRVNGMPATYTSSGWWVTAYDHRKSQLIQVYATCDQRLLYSKLEKC